MIIKPFLNPFSGFNIESYKDFFGNDTVSSHYNNTNSEQYLKNISERLSVLLIVDFDSFGGTRRYFYQLKNYYEILKSDVFFAVEPRIIQITNISSNPDQLIFLPEWKFKNLCGYFQKFSRFFLFFYYQFITYIKIQNEVKNKKINLVVISTGYGDRYLSILALNIPCIYITHSIPQKSNNDKIFKLFLKKYLNSHKRIIAVSEKMKEMIDKCWGTEETKNYVTTVYNCSKKIDHSLSYYDTLAYRTTILTLGHVTWYKNPEFWIKVIECFSIHSQFKDYSWIWAGDGDLLEKCRKTITDKKITNASFIGYSANVQELYDKALIYFQPSILESFGLSVLDAMQRGIPCVVTRVGGLPELVIDGETGFIIEDGDMKGAVEKISWLLSHPEESEKMGRAGYLRYKNLFTEEKWIENMERIHKEILSEIPNNSK